MILLNKRMNNGSFRCITIFFVQMILNITACVDKHEERANVDIAGPYCRIENLQSYYNGLFFTLKISLDYDCYDMDEYVSNIRLFRPYWIETFGDTLILKKHPLRGPILSDSCRRAGNCPNQTIMSLARAKRSNLRMSNYNWFIEWQTEDNLLDTTFFPSWTPKTPFTNFSSKCLKLEIPCFKQNASLKNLYDDSSPDFSRATCTYCK